MTGKTEAKKKHTSEKPEKKAKYYLGSDLGEKKGVSFGGKKGGSR